MQRAIITETEAYIGPHDLASHASRGRTPRTALMFGNPGFLYVYLVYGLHHCVNVVTERQGYPAAVLIRSVLPFIDTPVKMVRPDHFDWRGRAGGNVITGPGRVTKSLGIDRQYNCADAVTSRRVWFERGVHVPARAIMRAPRIGVAYAGAWQYKPWRFTIAHPIDKKMTGHGPDHG